MAGGQGLLVLVNAPDGGQKRASGKPGAVGPAIPRRNRSKKRDRERQTDRPRACPAARSRVSIFMVADAVVVVRARQQWLLSCAPTCSTNLRASSVRATLLHVAMIEMRRAWVVEGRWKSKSCVGALGGSRQWMLRKG